MTNAKSLSQLNFSILHIASKGPARFSVLLKEYKEKETELAAVLKERELSITKTERHNTDIGVIVEVFVVLTELM